MPAVEDPTFPGAEDESPQYESVADWLVHNRLKAIVYTWVGGVGGSLAYQWTRPIPTSLKIIHSRMYAQAITLGSLAAMAAVETYAHHAGKN